MKRTAFVKHRLARWVLCLAGGLLVAGPALAASTLTVSNGGAHCGNFGLVVKVDATNAWVESDHPGNEPHYVVRFWFKTDSLPLTASSVEMFTTYSDPTPPDDDTSHPVFKVLLLPPTTGGMVAKLQLKYATDAGSSTSTQEVGPGWHSLEIDYASTGGGSLATKLDNASNANLSAATFTGSNVDFARWGAVGGTLPATPGYLQLDDFVSQRTGPIGPGTACTPNENTSPAPLGYFTVTPCRVYDSRNDGPNPGNPLPNNVERTILVGGVCLIPTTAKSVSLNVTTTGAGSVGEIALYPSTVGSPGTSAIWFRSGKELADQVIMSLSPTFSIKAKARMDTPSATVHFIIDVNGYYQ